MKQLSFPSGTTGFYNDENKWICTGSQMGRCSVMPDDKTTLVKLRLVRLPFVDGCYDRWGAYWGSPANVWCATNRVGTDGSYLANGEGQLVELFFRANDRREAKAKVHEQLPNARFYR